MPRHLNVVQHFEKHPTESSCRSHNHRRCEPPGHVEPAAANLSRHCGFGLQLGCCVVRSSLTSAQIPPLHRAMWVVSGKAHLDCQSLTAGLWIPAMKRCREVWMNSHLPQFDMKEIVTVKVVLYSASYGAKLGASGGRITKNAAYGVL